MKAAHAIQSKSGNKSKSIWTTVLINMKRMRNFLDGVSLWGGRIQVMKLPDLSAPSKLCFWNLIMTVFTVWKFQQAVEGIHGSNVALVLYFLRWTFLLNVALMLLWIGMVVFPFIVHPPPHFSWRVFAESSVSQLLQVSLCLHAYLKAKTKYLPWWISDENLLWSYIVCNAAWIQEGA